MNKNNNFLQKLINISIKEAEKAYKFGDIPIGAIIFKNNTIISKAHNCTYRNKDSTLHAELIAIKKACKKLKSSRLDDYSLFTTLEPCAMCAGAIILAHIKKLLILTPDHKAGACGSVLSIIPNNNLNYSPIIEFLPPSQEYIALLKNFFKILRNK